MNILLWIAQGILAGVFAGAGIMKLVTSKPKLEQMKGFGYVTERTPTEMKLRGLAEVLGAFGLILPWLLRLLPALTPLAALALAVLMSGAFVTHRRRKEPVWLVSALLVLLVFVAVGRALSLS